MRRGLKLERDDAAAALDIPKKVSPMRRGLKLKVLPDRRTGLCS